MGISTQASVVVSAIGYLRDMDVKAFIARMVEGSINPSFGRAEVRQKESLTLGPTFNPIYRRQ
jgi:hypothetical protein